jgi:diguanylate cyclase (GGDEF)-like protein
METPTLPARRLLALSTAIALGALLVHAAVDFDGAGEHALFDTAIPLAIDLLAVLVCAARVVRAREQQAAWACIAASLLCWLTADVLWALLGEPTGASLADVFYLAFYPLCCAGLGLLLAHARDRLLRQLWLDGVIGGLAFAALAAALLFQPIWGATRATASLDTFVNAAYPLGDLLLIGFVLTAVATQGWRPGRGWSLLGLGAVVSAIADTIFLYEDAVGSNQGSALVAALWPASLACIAWAAWERWERRPLEDAVGVQLLAFPGGFAALALGLLAYGQFHPLQPAAAAFAVAALLIGTLRALLLFRENLQLLRRARREALTDGLTGLANRRQLMDDLGRAVAGAHRGAGRALAFFDLDGFKSYNDGFGHAAGDMLLDRLAQRLAAVVHPIGTAYRLGGDEFCVLLDTPAHAGDPIVEACSAALGEQGEGFHVTASYGVVTIPDEADSATHALQLADQRMYRAKEDHRPSSRRQACNVLLQVLREREPALHEHLHGVTALSVAVGRALGLTAEELDEIGRAAEMHDIGKLAIPDTILHKAGPLDEAEWRLMRQHTVIGDRILSVAPAMRPVARVVRSTHERFDGDGYPDRLAGEAIPLGARVIAVCDAYHAMRSARPYQEPRDDATALAELRRCAGTQFDPAVVEVFAGLLARAGAGDLRREALPRP